MQKSTKIILSFLVVLLLAVGAVVWDQSRQNDGQASHSAASDAAPSSSDDPFKGLK